MSVPELWIVAGPNGAGKTTCVKKKPLSELLPDVTFFNPDERTLAKLQSQGFGGFRDAPEDLQTRFFFLSADEVFVELSEALKQKKIVGVETVLSSDKYRRLVEQIQLEDGIFCLIYVALSSPAIAIERVADRVRRGGHGIPENKIEQRWKRSLENLPWFANRANKFWVIDNSCSDPEQDPTLVAYGKLGVVEYSDHRAFLELKIALSAIDREGA